MSNVRIIARLDIKGHTLIKGIQLEGLRVIGDPQEYASNYYEQGIDELLFVDAVASLYGRNNLDEIVRRTSHNVFVPMTVAGGIRSIEDVECLLRAGADKIGINTAAIKNPKLVNEVAYRFGSQCMVLSIEAKQVSGNKWVAYYDNGREKTAIDVVEWVVYCSKNGAGEILLTSVDKEGTREGFDIDLVKAVSSSVKIPVIASGGMGDFNHFSEVVCEGKADAVAVADILHYGRSTVKDIRNFAISAGISVRKK